MTTVTLMNYVAAGDLTGDGTPEVAVVLATSTGGTGVFRDLAVVEVQNGKPVNVAVTPLGDRVKIKSLTIQNGAVVVDMLTQGPHDPMVNPTQEIVQTYKLQGDQLVLTSSKPVGGNGGPAGRDRSDRWWGPDRQRHRAAIGRSGLAMDRDPVFKRHETDGARSIEVYDPVQARRYVDAPG
jgi:hypothetical protein